MTDTVRMVFTYSIAAVIVVGGGAIIWLSDKQIDPTISLAIGAAIAFVFGQETGTRAARQTIAASESGAVTHANGIANVAHAAEVATAARPPETRG
jgi:hypothetical protein